MINSCVVADHKVLSTIGNTYKSLSYLLIFGFDYCIDWLLLEILKGKITGDAALSFWTQ